MRPLCAIGALALCGCGPSAAAERPLLQPRLGEGAPQPEHGLTLRCDDAVDSLDTLPPSYAELLGAVALASDHPAPSPSDGMLFAKSGLVVRAGHASTLETAKGSSLREARLGIGVGVPCSE